MTFIIGRYRSEMLAPRLESKMETRGIERSEMLAQSEGGNTPYYQRGMILEE